MKETLDINATVIVDGKHCHLWIGIRRSEFEAILSGHSRSAVLRGKANVRAPERTLSTVLRKLRKEGIQLSIPFDAVHYGRRRLAA